jgi:hypothetical protein
MNERIKSLIERAEYQAQKQSGSDWEVHVEPSREQIFEKFAELIVRECARVYWNIDDGEIHGEYVKALKEHFGVEEK